MKKNKVYLKVFVISIFMIGFLFSCDKVIGLKRLQELEEGVSNPNTEAELKDAISKYKKRVDDIMMAEGRVGIWYKILGSRYMDKKMYKKALESFNNAVEYYPENQNLFYQIGLASSLVAKNSLDFELTGSDGEKRKYFSLAVAAYTRAIELSPKHSKAIYALSVLYIFELNKPLAAIPLLEDVLKWHKKPVEYLFLLGAAYYNIGESDKAVQVYQRIIETSANEEKKKQASDNIIKINENLKN